MTSDDLLNAALALPEKGKSKIGPILPVAIAMIAKGYTHADIYAFLKKNGAKVAPTLKNFSSALSKRVKRERIRQLEKASR